MRKVIFIEKPKDFSDSGERFKYFKVDKGER